MTSEPSPDWPAPSGQRLARSVLAAIVVAGVVLVGAVLPAEFGIDLTGIGRALRLDELRAPPTRTVEVRDVIGGNERVREVEIPSFNEPVPLPNPAVHQREDHDVPVAITLTVTGFFDDIVDYGIH